MSCATICVGLTYYSTRSTYTDENDNVFLRAVCPSNVGCLSLSGCDEMSEAVPVLEIGIHPAGRPNEGGKKIGIHVASCAMCH